MAVACIRTLLCSNWSTCSRGLEREKWGEAEGEDSGQRRKKKLSITVALVPRLCTEST